MTLHKVTGFSRYMVQETPFAIIDTASNREVAISQRKQRGNPTAHLIDDSGNRKTLSIITIACLAFRGLSPEGWKAYHSGGNINKNTVRWIPTSEYNGLIRTNLTLNQKDKIIDLYFSGKFTQDQLAEKFNVSQAQISRTIKKMGKRS